MTVTAPRRQTEVVASDAATDASDALVAERRARGLTTRPAPEPLQAVQVLVNTRNALRGYDLLAELDVARQWLAAGAPSGTTTQLSEAELDELVGIREALRALLLAHTTGQPPPDPALDVLRSAAERHPLRLTFDEQGRPGIAAATPPTTAAEVVTEALASLASASDDTRGRLRACANPDCGWVFYDTSRSRTGSWCLMDVCGARHKMSRYRDRRAAAEPDPR
jgi:predicted RNA-binding Zn ribbon-like protein